MSILMFCAPTMWGKQILISKKRQIKISSGTSLLAQWLRICLPVQGTWVQSLLREGPTCHGATKPVHHNYWACALEPVSHNYWAHEPQLLKPAHLEPMLHNKRNHHSEKHVHRNEEEPPLAAQQWRPNAAKNKLIN